MSAAVSDMMSMLTGMGGLNEAFCLAFHVFLQKIRVSMSVAETWPLRQKREGGVTPKPKEGRASTRGLAARPCERKFRLTSPYPGPSTTTLKPSPQKIGEVPFELKKTIAACFGPKNV